MTPSFKQELKGRAHHLKPVIIIGGDGLTPGVHNEIDRALTDHELIKIRVNAEDRVERKAITAELVNFHKADLVGSVGHIIIIYRLNPDAQWQRKVSKATIKEPSAKPSKGRGQRKPARGRG
jgi:RNA-binding protein